MKSALWIVGMLIGSSVVFSLCEFAAHLSLYRRVREILGGRDDVIDPVDPVPLKFPVGAAHVTAEISRGSIELLRRASMRVGTSLKFAGFTMGLLGVAVEYGILLFVAPASSVPYWGLLFLPVSAFAHVGERDYAPTAAKLEKSGLF